MTLPYRLLRDALRQLSLDAEEQRKVLARTVVTDELALDLDDAIRSLDHAAELAGVALPDSVLALVHELNDSLDAPSGSDLWQDSALDRHPTWAAARSLARRLLPLLPPER